MSIGDVTVDGPPSSRLNTDFPEPDSPSAKLIANRLIEMMDGSSLVSKDALDRLNEEAVQALAAEKIDLGEPVNEHPDDPALAAKLKMKIENGTFADALAALAECSGLAVVSDSFEKSFVGLSFPNDEIELRSALNKIELICRYNWEKHGSTLELRDRDWFRKRAAQVPEAWIEPWRKAFKTNETLRIYELSQIAGLTIEQYWANVLADDILGSHRLANLIAANWDLLRAYASLSDSQKSALYTEAGLDLESLSPSQWTTASRIFRGNTAFTDSSGAGCRLTARQEQEGKQFKYTFTASSRAQDGPMVWTFTTPKYEPPKKEEPKEKPK
jgi:hypothetical protein